MLLDFGKHKGTEIEDAPLSYVIFLAGYRLVGSKRMKSDLAGCKWVHEHRKDVYDYARAYLENICWHCGNKIVPVGSSRMNGAAHDDWYDRYLHKQCWRKLKQQEDLDA
jgi:hypothetical protein